MDDLPMDPPDHPHGHGAGDPHPLTPRTPDDELELYDLDDPTAVDGFDHDLDPLQHPFTLDDDPASTHDHHLIDSDEPALTDAPDGEDDPASMPGDHDPDGPHPGALEDEPDHEGDTGHDQIRLPISEPIQDAHATGDSHDAGADHHSSGDPHDDRDPETEDGSDGAPSDVSWPAPDHGVCDAVVVGHLAATLGATIELEDVGALVDEAVQADPDLADGLDARTTVRLLHDVGIQAGLEYGSVDTLADHLRSGRSVVLGVGDDDGLTHITAIDEGEQTVTYRSPDGALTTLPLQELTDIWEGAASEMLMADGLDPSTEGFVISLDAPGITVLPIPPPSFDEPAIR